MLILTLPVVMPVLKALGVDMIWFGVVAVLIIQMGILSPPVGLNVFIVKGIVPDVPMYTIFRGIWPFWYAMGLLIVLLLIFPQLALFLPNTMFGMKTETRGDDHARALSKRRFYLLNWTPFDCGVLFYRPGYGTL